MDVLVCGKGVGRVRLPARVCLLNVNAGEEVPLYSVRPCVVIPGNFSSSSSFSYSKGLKKEK